MRAPSFLILAALAVASGPALAQDPAAPPTAATSVVIGAAAAPTGPLAATTAPGAKGATMSTEHPLCGGRRNQSYGDAPPLDPSKGRVVFFRESSFIGIALSFRVREGDAEFCTLSNGSYFVLDMAPGLHRFGAHTVGGDDMPLEVAPGETHYVQVRMALGITYTPNFTLSNAAAFDKTKRKLNFSTY